MFVVSQLPPATAGLEVIPPQADERLEGQKRHEQVHSRLLTQANWLLNRSYKNDPLIFGETPGRKPKYYLVGDRNRQVAPT